MDTRSASVVGLSKEELGVLRSAVREYFNTDGDSTLPVNVPVPDPVLVPVSVPVRDPAPVLNPVPFPVPMELLDEEFE